MRSFSPEVENALIEAQDKFVWEAPAFEFHSRGPVWYFIMAIVSVLLIAYAVYTANFLFAFIILLIAILVLLVGNKKPKSVLIQIGENGMVFDGQLLLWQDVDNFSIVYQPPVTKRLYIEQRSALRPRTHVLLEDEDPIALREFLRRHINENFDLQYEPISDTLARLLKL